MNGLLHGAEPGVVVDTDIGDVVTLKDGGGRKHNVGVTRGGGPHKVCDNHRFGLLPGTLKVQCLRLMRKGIAARPKNQADIGVGDFSAVEVNRLSGI